MFATIDAYSCILIVLLALGETNSASVLILESGGSVRSRPFVLTINEQTGVVPLQLVGFNGTAFATCKLTLSDPGLSKADFSISQVGAGISRLNLTYRLVSAGRTNVVRCYPSSINGTELPSQNSMQSNQLNFTVKASAYLSFCSTPIVLANDGSTAGAFSLQFSETTSTFVTVSCTVNRTDATQIGLSIVSQAVAVGLQTAQMLYNITSKQYGGVHVICSAQSVSGSYQYVSSTSKTDWTLFILDRAAVDIFPKAIVTHTATFKVLLSLNSAIVSQSGTVVKFSCSAAVYAAADQTGSVPSISTCTTPALPAGTVLTTATSSPTTASSSTPPTLPNSSDSSSSLWLVSESTVVFDEPNYLVNHSFDVTRSAKVTSHVVELVAVSCCASAPHNSNPRYAGLAANMAAVADLQPMPGLNASSATDAANVTVETALKNPAYVDMAPCPCDLTLNECDVQCCCDQECSKAAVDAFASCLTGSYGGNASTTADYACNSTSTASRSPDWSVVLCVVDENNADLGLFFETRQAARSNADFAAANTSQRGTSYRRSALVSGSSATSSGSGVGYSYGAPVQMTGSVSTLTLPQLTLDGRCLPTAPVRYLMSTSVTCSYAVTQDLCTAAGSPLSAASYISRPSVQSALLCPAQSPTYVVQRPNNSSASSSSSQPSTAPVSVTYRCATSSATYVAATAASAAAFGYGSVQNTSYLASQQLSLRSLGSASDAASAAAAPSASSACWWDNGYSAPPAPSYGADVCSNAVAEVLYNITWSGVDVVGMDVMLVFANVTIQAAPVQLSARYTATFTHSDSTPSPVSGNPGYYFGAPLVAGLLNVTTVDGIDGPQNYSTIVATEAPYLISADATALCQNAFRVPVSFQVNSVSQCAVMVSAADMLNCNTLRTRILAKLTAWTNVGYLSIGGIAYPNDTSQWVAVVREPFGAVNTSNSSTSAPAQSTTTTAAAAAAADAYPDSQFGDYTVPDVPVMQLEGECVGIPSSVHLTVMYAEVGRSLNVPIHQVVGAKLSYGSATWRILCTTSGCLHGAEHAFLLTTTASFVQVPPSWQPYPSSYEIKTALNCTLCTSAWSDLLYPISRDVPTDLHAYNLANFLWLVLFVVGIFVLTGPWWSCW